MRVYIKTEGGRYIGYGHIARCIGLYQACIEKGIEPVFVVNREKAVIGFLRSHSVRRITSCSSRDMLTMVQSDDIVIIDSYLVPKAVYEKAAGKARLLVSLDDYKRIHYPAGSIVLNGSLGGERLNYPRDTDITYLLGGRYSAMRKDFWIQKPKRIRKEIHTVLLAFGGSDDRFTVSVAKHLAKHYAYHIDVILKNMPRPPLSIMAAKVALLCDPSPACIKRRMQNADVCVSNGGQTTYELAACGVPTIGVCLAENQLPNLKGWSEKGFVQFVGRCDTPDIFKNIDEALRKLTFMKRIHMSNIGRKYVDGHGARRVVEQVLKIYKKT